MGSVITLTKSVSKKLTQDHVNKHSKLADTSVTYKIHSRIIQVRVSLYSLPTCESKTLLALALVAVASFNLLLLPLSECRYKSAAVSWRTSKHRVNPAIHLMLNLNIYNNSSILLSHIHVPKSYSPLLGVFVPYCFKDALLKTNKQRKYFQMLFRDFIEELYSHYTGNELECMFS